MEIDINAFCCISKNASECGDACLSYKFVTQLRLARAPTLSFAEPIWSRNLDRFQSANQRGFCSRRQNIQLCNSAMPHGVRIFIIIIIDWITFFRRQYGATIYGKCVRCEAAFVDSCAYSYYVTSMCLCIHFKPNT